MKLTEKDYDYFRTELLNLLQLPEIQQLQQYIQHGKITCLEHSISVAYSSYYMCKQFNMKVDYASLIRGAMLHDFFLYDWHEKDASHKWHGFHHPFTAYRNAKKLFQLNEIESNIILTHMWPLTIVSVPKYKESIMVSIADKFCSLSETFHIRVFKPDFT
jgi:Predicted HD superfamily hydrolase